MLSVSHMQSPRTEGHKILNATGRDGQIDKQLSFPMGNHHDQGIKYICELQDLAILSRQTDDLSGAPER